MTSTHAALVQTRAERLLDDMAATGATFVQTGDGNGTADSLRLLDRKAGVHATLTIASPGWKLQLDARGRDRGGRRMMAAPRATNPGRATDGWWLIVPHRSAVVMSNPPADPKDPKRSQHLTEGAWLRAYVDAGIRKVPDKLGDAEIRLWRSKLVALNAPTFARLPADLIRLCPKELRP